MPSGNKTGPEGMGPMTGRGAGYCAGSNVPGYMNPGGGRGMALRRGRRGGMGGGFGRGRGQGQDVQFPTAVPTPEPVIQDSPQPQMDTVQYDAAVEMDTLRSQAKDIASSLKSIQQRIEELEKQSTDQKAE